MIKKIIFAVFAIIISLLLAFSFLFIGITPLIFLTAFNIGIALFVYKKERTERKDETKPRIKNMNFIIPVIVTFTNYALLGIAYHIQNNTGWAERDNIFNLTGLHAWNTAIFITEVSLLVIILCMVMRWIFFCIRKINAIEFLIWFLMNITATFACIVVIVNRI